MNAKQIIETDEEHNPWTNNKGVFLNAYMHTLTASIRSNPELYSAKVKNNTDAVARRMVQELSLRNAHISPSVVAAAKKLGVKPNEKAICDFLWKE